MSYKTHLSTRDLINAGIFSALYFVTTFLFGMTGFIGPAFMLLGFALSTIMGGIVLALYAAKTPKFGAFALVGMVNGLMFMMTGHYVWSLIGCVALGFLADLLLQKTSMPLGTSYPFAYAVFSVWIVMPFVPLILNTDAYYVDIASQMGPEYAETMARIFQPWTIVGVGIAALVLGYVGGVIGIRVHRKYFESSGLL
ncbi:MptD family putative ECF transporter S component [Corynebacterium ulcerans]|uniref:ABC transporter permease n=1 Tax=Corynebacterium ulcerans TaxID=65058 RepID=A0ABD0BKF6_CORUL|nr:MptD family putative ECF transporter S component [Corynebacterium ulcerans]AIU92676.1 Bacterial integral membrane protein (Trep_Strep) [Corynebacterium ulcerans]KPH74105.1 hypothetical protein AFK72_10300 [Corynebacterium ulcerans]MBH5302357.1 MptD family putative ECF transporter S component [Corynebacterium ulcerans]MBL4944875.1 MptD family putative ECF transporter S component [Corynebacterium ulcerans]OIS05692.1 hypothetical protein BHG00_08475 [Corynebacterium ulcerans]